MVEKVDAKSTGIVRRVDDLGRILIPRDIRRKLNISEADPLEFFVSNDGSIVLHKYGTDTIDDALCSLKSVMNEREYPHIASSDINDKIDEFGNYLKKLLLNGQ